MKQRSFVTVILFSLITCGIYWIYYCYVLTEDLKQDWV